MLSASAAVALPLKKILPGKRLAAFLTLAAAHRWLVGSAFAATTAVITTLCLYRVFFSTPDDAGSHPYYKLIAAPTDAADRLLLMNRIKTTSACPVDYDSFLGYTTPITTSRNWWEFLNEDEPTLDDYNLADGTHVKLHAKGDDGRVLWEMINCRGGNLNPYGASDNPNSYQNCLPWGDDAYSYKGRTTPAKQNTAGTLVFQNVQDARVVSSCLDSIGTIYFDCVNGFTDYKSGRIVVEVAYGVWAVNPDGRIKVPHELATVTDEAGVEHFVPPDDANCDEIVIVRQTPEGGIEETQTNAYARCAWTQAQLIICPISHGVAQPLVTNNVVQLEMPLSGNAGAFNNFYRVYAPVQDPALNPDFAETCHGPMRFCIRRTDDPPKEAGISRMDADGGNIGSPAKNGLLILDNIIASLPAMKASAIPGGEYVAGGSHRNVIGWTGVMTPDPSSPKPHYPKAGETGLSVTAGYSVYTNAPPDDSVATGWMSDTKAKMWHRLRYLEFTNSWDSLNLAFDGDRLVSTTTLSLPDLPGDFEYYYDMTIDAPYYGYVDYSGTGLGTPGYSERVAHVESHYDAATAELEGLPSLPSRGTEFFTRLREGASDQLEYRLELRSRRSGVVTQHPFYLMADLTWKTFVRTTTNEMSQTALLVGDYEYRFVGVKPSVAYVSEMAVQAPVSAASLRPQGDPDLDWSPIRLDATTGALMFQLVEGKTEEALPVFTVVHASYQDFTTWADAKSAPDAPVYVGAFSEEKGKMSGSSDETRTFPSELGAWSATAGENATFWTENFPVNPTETPEMGWGGYRAYEEFGSCTTRNGWQAVNGFWACAQWRQSAMGGDMALQMRGAGKGSIAFVNQKHMPRGLDSLRLKARIAQSAKFEDFAYYMGGTELSSMYDYVFTTRAIMATTDASTEFDGNGSVSLVCCYQPGEGCYEMRAERSAIDTITLYLYKWEYDLATDTILPRMLGRHANTRKFKSETYLRSNNAGSTSAEQTSGYYAELFIRCRQDGANVIIEGGVMSASKKLGDSTSNSSHYYFKFTDSDNPYTFGTFGFGSVNCPAQFINPLFYQNGAAANVPNVSSQCYNENGAKISNPACGNGTIVYPSGDPEQMFQTYSGSSKYRNWSYKSGKYENVKIGSQNAVKAVPAKGTLELFLTEDGGREVSTNTYMVSGFQFDTNVVLSVRNQTDSLLRLATGKNSSDIVVDDLSFNQWCAGSYDDGDQHDFDYWTPSQACPLHYVYVNGMVDVSEVKVAGETVTNRSVALQPMRAKLMPNGTMKAMSIRAPLMDGNNDSYGDPLMQRGLGLGMISYTYRNADAHCRILVQYKEMDSALNLKTATDEEDGWTTVATNDFSTMKASERLSGTLSTYLGLHGVKGVMRLVVDPKVVAASRDKSKNPGGDPLYGSIVITDFMSRDEPPIDMACWWGWNLRTTDALSELSIYDSSEDEPGLAMALNNSVTDQVDSDPEIKKLYPQHLPFVQTPTFGTNVVGEIAFRARRLPGVPEGQFTEVAVLGAKDGQTTTDAEWTFLTNFVVKTDVYERYSYKTRASDNYTAFRLAVIGVKDLEPGVPAYKEKMDPAVGGTARRVLLDEIEVSEAVRGEIGFFNVGAFRTPLDVHELVTNLYELVQQPMCEEAWSVQCEVRKVQLEDEVILDDDTEVYLNWYVGKDKWGWKNWINDPKKANRAKLARVPGRSDFVFRGSYPLAGAAVIAPIFDSGTVVQYVVEAHFKMADGSDPGPRYLSAGEWTKPTWYTGVDYNAGHGDDAFAAYTILDTVAFGYAWINEVNIYDGPGVGTDQRTNQYVEVAIPSEASIKGWQLQFITGGIKDTDPVYTNTVVTYADPEAYPDLVPCKKSKNMDPASKYVFITAGNPQSVSPELKEKGWIDGAWSVKAGDLYGGQLKSDGSIDCGSPIGIRLVRPSGIIEHQIVVAGTNQYEIYGPPYSDNYSPTNFVKKMRKLDNPLEPSKSTWYFTGYDNAADPTCGRSVTNFTGVATDTNVWAYLTKTPGRKNVGEWIPPEHPHPQGSMIVLYAQLADAYADQTIAQYERSTENLIVYVPKGLQNGTNITYHVKDWHEIAEIAETEETKGTRLHPEMCGRTGVVAFPAAKNASNDITVVMKTGVRGDLVTNFLLTADNAYTPAVMDWLEKGMCGKTAKPFAHPGGEIKLAAYHDFGDNYRGDLRLIEMYWLDMDPTMGDLVLQAGFTDDPMGPKKVTRPGPGGTEIVCEDFVATILAKIYRKGDASFTPYAPYTLNGIEPGSSSRVNGTGWSSATFKITAHILEDRDPLKDPDKVWYPVRYFYFDDNSFDANFKAKIQVMDPFYQLQDWAPWKGSGAPAYKAALDTRKFGAAASELLRPDSTFK